MPRRNNKQAHANRNKPQRARRRKRGRNSEGRKVAQPVAERAKGV